jgi:alpha-L-rhamnosidase
MKSRSAGVLLASLLAFSPSWGGARAPFAESPGAQSPAAQAPAVQGAGAPARLTCEYVKDPLGLDVKAPRFSWLLSDARRGAVQTAYQVLVAESDAALQKDEGSMWDSGKVPSGRSIHVVYAGKPLASRKTYSWKVRAWDVADAPSPWSEPAHFEMALLGPEDWTARWISLEKKAPGMGAEVPWGQWIWHKDAKADGAKVFFRGTLDLSGLGELAGKIDKATVKVTADDAFELFVNGEKVGSGTGWNVANVFDLKDRLKPGRNVVAAVVTNATGPGGLIAGFRVSSGDKSLELKTDASWRVSLTGAEGWTAVEFSEAGWEPAAVVGDHGVKPWGELKDPEPPPPSLCMRKEFPLKGPVARARVYSSGLGLYRLSINGKRVGTDVFSPGWTHYPKRIQYQVYDVTSHLAPGANAVGAVLGRGWWSGGLGWNQSFVYSTDNHRLILQLEVEYADGTQERFVTDETWKVHLSPILDDSFYHGVTYDARREMPGWDRPGLDDKGWESALVLKEPVTTLVAEKCEPIRVTKEITARKVARVGEGVYVLDFGQNFAGRVRMKVKGPAGTQVKLRFAEVLNPDGTITTANYRSARATDVYILKGEGEEEWEPIFTYRGFRYVEVTGYPGEPPAEAFTGLVLHTAAPLTGKFQCSNELLARIQENVTWGLRSNLHSVPTDCPQRDERLGWMGDTQAFAPTACFDMNLALFFSKWMRDIMDSQTPDGAVTDVAPVAVVSGPAAPGWGDAAVIVPWVVYQRFGDTRIIEENYDGMKAWVDYMSRNAKDHLYEREGYGDWVAPVASPKKPIGAAYYFRSAQLLGRMAAAIGKADDARIYADLAQKIADAFNARYLDPATSWYEGRTQTANLLPLHFGIVPPDRRKAVLGDVVEDIVKRDYHLSTGFLGTPCLLPELAAGGEQEVAYKVATQRTCPSWGYMVEKGATTIWELWNSDTQGPEMNSRNHFAFGVVGQWFYEDLAGINVDPEGPGYKRSTIRPRPAGDLEWARAEYDSVHGLIQSAWRKTDSSLSLEVSIPANTSATVYVPLLAEGDTVAEGDKTVLLGGKPAEKVDGLSFLRVEPGFAVFDAAAGHYTFQVTLPAKRP